MLDGMDCKVGVHVGPHVTARWFMETEPDTRWKCNHCNATRPAPTPSQCLLEARPAFGGTSQPKTVERRRRSPVCSSNSLIGTSRPTLTETMVVQETSRHCGFPPSIEANISRRPGGRQPAPLSRIRVGCGSAVRRAIRGAQVIFSNCFEAQSHCRKSVRLPRAFANGVTMSDDRSSGQQPR